MSNSLFIESGSLFFISGSYISSSNTDKSPTGSIITGKWEIDPDDGESIQFRVPKEKLGTTHDRIGFYISASGEIGIGTKDPESAFDVRDMGEDVDPRRRDLKTKILNINKDKQKFDVPISASLITASIIKTTSNIIVGSHITASGNISSSGTIVANKIEADSLVSHANDANTGLEFASDTVNIEGNNLTIATFASNRVELNKRTLIDAHLTASGNISSSGEIYGTDYYIDNQALATRHGSGDISIGNSSDKLTIPATNVRITGPVTASGDISSSGTVISNETTTTTLRAANGSGLIHDKKIWIAPTDFDTVSVDGINRGVITDNGGNLADIGRRLTFYAQKYIPTGWKVTAVKIEGSNTADRFTAYSSSFDVGTSAAVCSATAIGTEVSLSTAVQGGGGVYLSIEWGSRGGTEVYGGYIQLTEN